MKRKLTFAIVELITIVVGTGFFVSNILGYRNNVIVGISASLILFGLLFRFWWKDIFFPENKEEIDQEKPKAKSNDKNFIIGFMIFFVFLFWGINKSSLNDIQGTADSIVNNVSYIDSNVNDIESDVSDIKKWIERW